MTESLRSAIVAVKETNCAVYNVTERQSFRLRLCTVAGSMTGSSRRCEGLDSQIVEASLRADDPQATVQTIRKGVFLRFYGHEFDADSRVKILAAIDRAAQPTSR